jgi:tRNA-(ms[2]io[6]A)-hydroxylase
LRSDGVIERSTDPRWLAVALEHFDEVLVDHAHCEKKAAASAMSLVASYPEHERLVRRLSALAIEELRHFRAVHRQLCARGLVLARDAGDPYARALLERVRHGRVQRLIDRLLVAGLIEARSCERLELLAGALPDPELARFYASLARAEAAHADLFVKLALFYGEDEQTRARLSELARAESEILRSLPIRPRIH